MTSLELALSYKDKKPLMGLIYPSDYKMKDLEIDAMRITIHDGVECYTKFNFWFIDPRTSENKEITSYAELMKLYDSYEIKKANQIKVEESIATI